MHLILFNFFRMVAFFLVLSVLVGVLLGNFFGNNENLAKRLLVGMFIHAFIEGIPLAGMHLDSPYLLGILVHNLPISFVLGAFLLREKKNKLTAWVTIAFFAAASPLGMVLGKYFKPEWQAYFLALSGGIFLHISSVIIFENNSKSHQINWEKMFLVILGVGVALAGHLFHEHSHH